MNADRRATAQVCIELIKECSEIGEMSEASHAALEHALKTMKQAEFWSLKNQTPHRGKNSSTDTSIRIGEVALPALEQAYSALVAEDYNTVIDQLALAATTDGTPATPNRKKK